MTPPPPATTRHAWTRRQRVALGTAVLVGCLVVGWEAQTRPETLADPPPPEPALASQLADRIDPNVAPAEHLAMLPGIGPSKADAIIAYREQSRRQPAFQRPSDLARVRGFGTATVEKLSPYLVFPRESPDVP